MVSMMTRVTDPKLLELLNAPDNTGNSSAGLKKVSDPNILKQLNSPSNDSSLRDIFNYMSSMTPANLTKSAIMGLGQAGENIASTLTGGRAPRVMEDVKKMLQTSPETIYSQGAEAAGQYAPLALTAPAGLLGQIGASAGYQALQTPGSPLEIATAAAIPPILKGVGKLFNVGKQALTGLSPYEEVAQKGAQQSELANQEAISPKPGLYPNAKTELENIENEIGKHINVEGEHSVRSASAIKNRVNSIQKFWSDSYKLFEDKVRDNKFLMPEKSFENLTYDKEQILKRIKQGADPKKVMKEIEKENTNPFYKSLMENAPTSEDVNAADFLAKYKEFRDALGGLKSDLKSERYGSVEKKQISKAIEKGETAFKEIKQSLDEGLGEFKPEFDWLNKGYSEQVFPLRNNPLVKKSFKGNLPDDILKQLRTNESGMQQLRELVKQDPELLRNIIGQKYLKKPSSIFSPNEHTREFLNEMPEFQKLLSQREKALEKFTKQKDISLKEKVRAEKELEDIKKSRTKARKFIGYTAGAGAIGIPGANYLSKLLNTAQQEGISP